MMRHGRLVRAGLTVTALSAAAGSLVGLLLAGAFVMVIVFSGADAAKALPIPEVLALGAAVGAGVGICLGPLVGFGLLRAVPLWVAILGTVGGSLAGFLGVMIFGWNPVISIPGGCFVAALLLRWRYSRRAMTP